MLEAHLAERTAAIVAEDRVCTALMAAIAALAALEGPATEPSLPARSLAMPSAVKPARARVVGDVQAQILAALRKGPKSRSELCEITGEALVHYAGPLAHLASSNQVHVVGRARAARWHLGAAPKEEV